MRVTEITKTKRGRYSLHVDGEFLFSIHSDSYLRTGLSVGQELTIQQLEELRQRDQLLSAKSSALDILARSAQTSGILRDKLLRYYDEDAVDSAVERMTELGLVNDADYAARFVRDCMGLRGYSIARTRQALLQKKLAREIVDEAIADLDTDETDPITALILKKYRNKLAPPDDLRRTIAALGRRGFGYDDIKAALRRIEDEELYTH